MWADWGPAQTAAYPNDQVNMWADWGFIMWADWGPAKLRRTQAQGAPQLANSGVLTVLSCRKSLINILPRPPERGLDCSPKFACRLWTLRGRFILCEARALRLSTCPVSKSWMSPIMHLGLARLKQLLCSLAAWAAAARGTRIISL